MRKSTLKFFAIAIVTMVSVSFAGAIAVAEPPNDGPSQDGPPRDGQRGRGVSPRGDDRQGHRPPPSPLVRALDTDKDGEISATEIENAPAALKTLDKDGDGALSREEIRPPHPRDRRPRGGPGDDRPQSPQGQDGANRPPGNDNKGPRPAVDPAEFIDRIFKHDKNGDGVLTTDELPERGQRMFEHADSNGDGEVDRGELEAAFKKRQQRNRPGPDGKNRPRRRPDPSPTPETD